MRATLPHSGFRGQELDVVSRGTHAGWFRRRVDYDEALGEMLARLMGRRPEMFTAPGRSGTALRLLLSRLAERRSALALELVNRLS